ncbi:CBS domain containing-hemolysin-like protein [Actinocorallia herbida]|uniref:CBS domain containing-hemolysin-like protein n=1 Tax=Actinocorallia herbida TaxID=58109 RepID=A0A3N1DCI7_9ACTN|nr:hemolysin family protein [Actinocorallia herbida]ROO91232.1 CBS domain containing-hemolysin-like protein [Actinocorallia herbida]
MSLTTGLVLTVLLLAGNGFFVAAEFALVAAKRPRLEQAAEGGSRAAAQAVAGIRELSLMLAGAQLGITICSLGLGVVAEPVIAEVLTPVFHDAGLSDGVAHVVSFVIALALVTFLHMVVGEMAPKSWAIARPERSALLLAVPFRGFTSLFRPLLTALNHVTNGLLRLVRVEPRDQLEVSRTPEQLRHLVEESRRLGLIEEADRSLLSRALDAPRTGLGDLVIRLTDAVSVSAHALPQEVIDVSTRSGVTRLLLCTADGEVTGVVHAREAYLARAKGAAPAAGTMAHPIPVVRHDIAVADAVTDLRLHRSQLALVRDEAGEITGMISLDDLLTRLLAPA